MRKYKWRLYADENIEKEIVTYLRNARMDVVWVIEDPSLRAQKDDTFHYEKARQMKRYFVTKDEGFWSDERYPLHQSPGVIIVTTQDKDMGAHLILLLRKLLQDFNPLVEPLYMDRVKVRLSESGFALKFVDNETSKRSVEQQSWKELF